MSNVSARQNVKPEASAFREYLRPFMGNGITFRMTPYKIGQAMADRTADSVRADFTKSAEKMVDWASGTDTDFCNYAQGYIDRAIELCAHVPDYQAKVKAAFKVDA